MYDFYEKIGRPRSNLNPEDFVQVFPTQGGSLGITISIYAITIICSEKYVDGDEMISRNAHNGVILFFVGGRVKDL